MGAYSPGDSGDDQGPQRLDPHEKMRIRTTCGDTPEQPRPDGYDVRIDDRLALLRPCSRVILPQPLTKTRSLAVSRVAAIWLLNPETANSAPLTGPVRSRTAARTSSGRSSQLCLGATTRT
jgi:hypothetical protein